MAKTEKKISIAAFDKAAKGHLRETVTKQWFDIEVRIRPFLPIGEMLAFVDDVVKSCLQDGMGYLPEVREFLVRCNVLTRYANFTLPEKLEHRYELACGTDAADTVMEEVDQRQLEWIVNAIEDKLDYLCNANAAELEKQVHRLEDSIESIAKQLDEVFSGVSAEDVEKLAHAMAEGGFREDKLVDAYMKQRFGDGAHPVEKAEEPEGEA